MEIGKITKNMGKGLLQTLKDKLNQDFGKKDNLWTKRTSLNLP